MVSPENIQIISTQFTFFNKLTAREKELLLNNVTPIKYKAGSNIHSGDNDCIGVLLIKSGVIRTYLLSEEGKDITLYRLYEGDVCVMAASCMLNNITFDVHIDADVDSEILLINTAFFSQLSNDNIIVENFANQIAMDRFSDVMWAMQQILFMSFDKRLAIFLVDELAKTDSHTIYLTHEQIAKYMGSAREVVSRMLKYFANEGIVELSRGAITVLDRKRLMSLI